MRKRNQVIFPTMDDHTERVVLSPISFNELVKKANKAKTYHELWQAEVDVRQDKMISAEQTIEEIERAK